MISNIQSVLKIPLQTPTYPNQVEIFSPSIIAKNFSLEKRKYSKQQELDHQQKSILVPSLACKLSSFIAR